MELNNSNHIVEQRERLFVSITNSKFNYCNWNIECSFLPFFIKKFFSVTISRKKVMDVENY